MRLAVLATLAVMVGACATMPTSAPPRSAPPGIPSGAVELGDWRRASAPSVLHAFEEGVSRRYLPGLPLSSVTADLRGNAFTCADNRDTTRGSPPDAICRKTVTAEGCTHTWQVHVFDENNDSILARARGLYDRRCGGDGLLGGPG